jgi:RNA polymerase sigma-70 factor (ECF subfamily)
MMRGLAPLDPDLIARLRRREPDALRSVVDEHGRRLYRAARGMGCSADAAGDVVQDVFVVFLESMDRFEGRAQVGTWLFGILHHKVQEQRRSLAREEARDPIDDVFDGQFDRSDRWIRRPIEPDRWMRSREAAAAIQGCLEGLTPLQRDVFHLRQVEELSGAEVSKILAQSVTHIGVLFHRARLRLRECLGKKGWTSAR